MSARFVLDAAPTPPPATTTDRWRQAAALLRRSADEVTHLVHDLATYHRHDVWQGAVADRFGDDLGHWRARLGDSAAPDGASVAADLLAAASRLEARALAIEIDHAGGLAGLWTRPPPP